MLAVSRFTRYRVVDPLGDERPKRARHRSRQPPNLPFASGPPSYRGRVQPDGRSAWGGVQQRSLGTRRTVFWESDRRSVGRLPSPCLGKGDFKLLFRVDGFLRASGSRTPANHHNIGRDKGFGALGRYPRIGGPAHLAANDRITAIRRRARPPARVFAHASHGKESITQGLRSTLERDDG